MAQEKKNIPEIGADANTASAPATSTVLKDDTKIKVQARVPAVFYTCPTTVETFSWLEVGDNQEMTYKQLRIMNSKYPRYFSEKWLQPLDEVVVKKLGLDKYFKNQIRREDYRLLFGSDVSAVKKLLSELSVQTKEEMKDKVVNYVKTGKIENAKIIRLLEKQFGIDLMELV